MTTTANNDRRPAAATSGKTWAVLAGLALGAASLVMAAACGGDGYGAGGATSTQASSGVGGAGGDGGAVSVGTGGGGYGGEGGDAPLCDPRFGSLPEPLESGAINRLTFTHPDPLVYVDLGAGGPGSAHIKFEEVNGGSDGYTWEWSVTGLVAGTWSFTFAAGDPAAEIASCTHEVTDTGPPPPPPAGCDGKSCGDPDGDGGICQGPCKVVGSHLANPSPCGPSEQDSPWQTLDNAECLSGGGLCKMWCPYEKCSGCPNGTEAVFVPSSETSYEAACQGACEAFGACWDSALSLCRNPGDCGTPLNYCPWQ